MNHLSPELLESIAEGGAASAEQNLHLESCPDCSRHLRELRNYFAKMKSLSVLKAPSGFSTRLRQRLDAEAAVPGWKRFLSSLFNIRRIPLQLAGAGFAALLLFWALPRYQNLVPQSETEAARNRPPSPAVSETITITEAEPKKETEAVEDEVSSPEPPRPPLPSDLGAKKSGARRGGRAGNAADRDDHPVESDKKDLPWSQAGDLAMIEVAEASTPEPVKTEMPASAPAPMEAVKEKSALRPRKRAAAKPTVTEGVAARPSGRSAKVDIEEGAGTLAAPKVETKSKPMDMALSRKSEESAPAPRAAMEQETMGEASATAPSPPPTVDSLLRAMGFKRETRKGRSVQILRLSKAGSDSIRDRLREMGLEKLLILHALPGDSLEIEIR